MRASNVRGDERLAICHGDAGLIVRCAVDADGSEEGGKSASMDKHVGPESDESPPCPSISLPFSSQLHPERTDVETMR